MPAAMTALATLTLGSAASTVTFSSIPATYRDLRLVCAFGSTRLDDTLVAYNSDTSNIYTNVEMVGTGSAAQSSAFTRTGAFLTYTVGGSVSTSVMDIFDYSATDKHKSHLSRNGMPTGSVSAVAGRWPSTSAITSLRISCQTGPFNAGTTFSLYGILA